MVTMAMATRLAAVDAAGRYALQGEREVGSELILRPNGRFEYMLAYGAADYSAKGTWKQAGSAIVLTTEGVAAEPFHLVKSSLANTPATRIWIKDANGQGVPNTDVQMSGKQERTSPDGMAEFAPEVTRGPVKILIPVYRVEAGPYPIRTAHTDHIFEINGSAITTVRFTDERLAMKDGELMLRFWNPDHALRYARVH